MKKRSTAEIRNDFLEYFKSHEHSVVPSASLLPENDPSLLFTNAGMVPFKDNFLGLDKKYTRATSAQKCVRAGGKHNDLENVGFTERHHTFFEMLGNFSFGSYFKKEAIHYAWDFVTNVLKLPKERLCVSVFETDDEAAEIWHKQEGVPLDRIKRFGEEDNFWSMGPTGPCGPCSEIFWDQGEEVDGDRWLEFWNLVFMQYNRQEDGSLLPLEQPCVDTGMGLERMATILQGVRSNYDIDLFSALIQGTKKYFEKTFSSKIDLKNSEELSALRVVVDHLRSTSFLIADGVLPSNEGRGYVLRRILRRAVRFGKKLGAEKAFLFELFPLLEEHMGVAYPQLEKRSSVIVETLRQEEEKFFETLERGLNTLEQIFAKSSDKLLPSQVVFQLYDSFGFPLDLTELIAKERGFQVNKEEVDAFMKEQQARSRASWKGSGASALPVAVKEWQSEGLQNKSTFYTQNQAEALLKKKHTEGKYTWLCFDPNPFYAESGGQVGDAGVIEGPSGALAVDTCSKAFEGVTLLLSKVDCSQLVEGKKYSLRVNEGRRRRIRSNHTSTHLLHAALKETLGDHVAQAGSHLDHERLRFDFSQGKALTEEEIEKVELWVNERIKESHKVEIEEKSFDEAKEMGATALFGEKYGDRVRVVNIPEKSMELCGGLHVSNTSEIVQFKILEESGVAAGTRRIEAVSEEAALSYFKEQEALLKCLARKLKSPLHSIDQRIDKLLLRQKKLEDEIKNWEQKFAQQGSQNEEMHAYQYRNNAVELRVLNSMNPQILRQKGDLLRQKAADKVHVLWSDPHVLVTADVSVVKDFHSGKFLSSLASAFGGKGGGQEKTAQGKVPFPKLEKISQWMESQS